MRDTINTDRHIYPLPVGYRVFWAEAAGQQCDAEPGLAHTAHAAWCALARLELMLRDEEV